MLVAPFNGTDRDLAGLLSELVDGGIPVTRFAVDAGTLEDIFLQITDMGEVD